MTKNKKALLIVFSCMLLQAIPYSMAQNVSPLFIKPLEKTYGFDLQQIGYIFTIGAVAASLVSPIAGKFYKSKPVKLVMWAGVLICGSGLIINSFAKNLGTLLLGGAITQIGTIIFSGLGIPYLIATWFDKQDKAKALGVAFAGGSIGNFFLQPIVENLLSKYSVQFVYSVCGITALVVGSIVVLLFIHPNQEFETQTNSTNNQPTSTTMTTKQSGIGYASVMKLKSFWVLSFFYLLIGLAIAALSTQYADYFESIGVAKSSIGLIGSVFAIACLVGNLGGGVLFDKFGVVKTMGIAFILQLLALGSIFLGFFNRDMALVAGYGWAIFYGLNVFSYMSGPAIMMQNMFGMKDTSQILGTFSIFFAIGFAVGNVVFGIFVDKLGFVAGWTSVLCYVAIGFVGLLSVMKAIMSQNYAMK